MTLCQVIVDITSEQVDRVFTYILPEGMEICPGTRVLVPFGPRRLEGVVVSLDQQSDLPPEKLRAVLRPLEDYPAISPELLDLAHWLKAETHCTLAQALRLMFPAQMRSARVEEKTMRIYRLADPQGLEALLPTLARAKAQQALLCFLRDAGEADSAQIHAAFPTADGPLRALVKAGHVCMEQRAVRRRPYPQPAAPVADPKLTGDQEQVLQQVLPSLERGEGSFLLHGVTGSGKTEIYIRLVRRALSLGKRAIVLVPEIALTPQMVDWFRGRFGEGTAVLHSRLSMGERFDEWRRVLTGEAQVVIGARSAVFAPVRDLGIIIVDEEHEQTYLSEHMPQYDARRVAQRRCEAEGATLLLASATPSMRSFAQARKGELTLLELPERVLGRSLPEVTLVDMREELSKGNQSVLSAPLAEALGDCLRSGKQAILMMNRRGYSTFVSCRSCGYVVQCPNCDVSLTYHQAGEAMRCHYCGHTAPTPKICPECGSAHIRFFGAGTQRVEEAVQKLFPRARLLRMDVDTTRTRDAHAKLLQQFRDHQADILIGTQMIAKGLDFPKVTVVGVIAADSTLNLPDYRAAERCFQLVTQVAGRAGRADHPGQVYVQTYQPDHYAITCAAAQDYRAFFETEMQRRRRQLYPPYTLLARILTEDPEEDRAMAAAADAQTYLTEWLRERPEQQKVALSIRLDKAPLSRLRGKQRAMLLLKLIDTQPAKPILQALADYLQQSPGDTARFLEINPSTLI